MGHPKSIRKGSSEEKDPRFEFNFQQQTTARVPHISLVFREMWDTTNLTLRFSMTHFHTLRNRLLPFAHPQKSLTL
jgi:hypothetical protein